MSTISDQNVVSTQWLAEHLGADGPRILDATVVLDIDTWEANSGRVTFEEAHIPGANFIDLIEELSDASADAALPKGVRAYKLPPSEQFEQAIASYGIDNETDVVVYDTTGGMWAARLWWLFRVFGHDRVAVLDGGWAKWVEESLPVESEVTSPSPSAGFKASFRPELLATKEQVKEISENGGSCLIHALSPEMFTGEDKAALRRPGRIPGSVNVPFFSVYEEDGTFRSADELREVFADALAGQNERIITYCGGGIAASADALALALIGVEAAVYDGSLVEWSGDESLPLAVG
jgi:thiosulfate/3-mercaptopyruvate sulfurtransferase